MKDDKVRNLKGEGGGVFIDGAYDSTTDPDGVLVGIVAIEDSTISAITMESFGGTESKLVGKTLYAGSPLFGSITSITVSGLIQGLKR